jgi:apolipoprotein N-acyltransferase
MRLTLNTTLTTRDEMRTPPRGRLSAAAASLARIHKSAWLLALSSAALRAREADAAELLEGESYSYLAPASPLQAFFLGWTCGTGAYLGSCYFIYTVMHDYGHLGPAISVVMLLLFSMHLGLHQAAFAALLVWAARSRAGDCRRALFLTPLLWVTVELLREYLVGIPWDLLGTVQIDNIALSQIARFTGVYGLSFEIALVNAAFAAIFLVQPSRRRLMLAAAVITALMLQSAQFLKFDRAPADHRALLVQQNVAVKERWQFPEYSQLLQSLDAVSNVPENPGGQVDLVVWPESSAPLFLNDRLFSSTISGIAQRLHAYTLAGSIGLRESGPGAGGIYNSAALFTPQGQLAGRYDKVHLVPFGEYIPLQNLLGFARSLTHEVGAFARGNDRGPLQAGAAKLGVFICYESSFPSEVREFAALGAQVFINVSNDAWFGNSGAPEQHLNMARMRAVENGRWLLRDTNTGITAAIDPLGRVVAQTPMGVRMAIVAPYALRAETTFYTRYGDWFPIGCAIISIVGLLFRRRFNLAKREDGV